MFSTDDGAGDEVNDDDDDGEQETQLWFEKKKITSK